MPKASRLRIIFIGNEGLRAGWSILIFLVIFAFVVAIGNLALRKTHVITPLTTGAPDITLSFGFAYEAVSALAALLATWIVSKIERRGRSYGFGGPRRGKLFLAGLISGLFLISLLVFALWKSGLLVLGRRLFL